MTSRVDGLNTSSTLAVSEAGRKISPRSVESSLGMKGGSKAPEWVAKVVDSCTWGPQIQYWITLNHLMIVTCSSTLPLLCEGKSLYQTLANFALFLISLCSKEAIGLRLRAWHRQHFQMECRSVVFLVDTFLWWPSIYGKWSWIATSLGKRKGLASPDLLSLMVTIY